MLTKEKRHIKNMILTSSYILLGVVFCANVSNGFFSKHRKQDCLVSAWSTWSEPFGFGTIRRERRILRYARNGGTPCPADLTETQSTNDKPTIKQTASAIASSFLRHDTQLSYRQSGDQLRDLLVIVDSSGSIGKTGFDTAKTQLAELLGLVCPTPDPFRTDSNHAALIEYSTKVIEVFDFNDKKNTKQIQTAINNMAYLDQSTCTASAFEIGKNMFISTRGMRSNSKHEVLILTDGASNCRGNVKRAAKALQETADVYALVIGIKQNSDTAKELLSYVSWPTSDHLFAIDGYQDLGKLVELIKEELKTEPCAPFDMKKRKLRSTTKY